ncbi:MAG TPA: hypothetical protein PKA13_02560 [Geminicoccaceae bacterium]|nr:hypothetical protein [Geminicoccus sp.]HMU48627.1 hypothetical protein [Geminicoccaceae bacterium]
MSDLSLTETMEVLNPYLEDIDACLRGGVGTYKSYDARNIAEHTERATRACIHDHQIVLARRLLVGRPGVAALNVRGLVVLDFHGQVCLRFKKVNGAGRGRNLQTMQQRLFDRQIEMPGLPKAATRVVAGYVTDAAGLDVRQVLISCPLGREILWCVQVGLDRDKRWEDITPVRIPGTERFTRYGQA